MNILPVGSRRLFHLFVLTVILAVGFSLRIWGIGWGLPLRPDIHPDEHDYVMTHALKLSVSRLDPGFLNYPAFLMYLTAGVRGLLIRAGFIGHSEWVAYLIGRLWSVAFATATIWAVYRLARELKAGRLSAWLSSLWVALLPLHVWDSHVAVTDILMTFWTVMTLWASVRLTRKQRFRDFAFAGICLGLATGSKYTAALAVVAVLVGALAGRRSTGRTLGGLVLAGGMALACAFLVMPYSFIRLPDLLAAMNYEHQHTVGHHYGFSIPAAGWQYHRYLYQLVAAWPFSFGFVLYASALAGMAWIAVRQCRRHLPVLVFMAVFFGITGHWSFTPLRYYLPLVVAGAMYAGLWHGSLMESSRKTIRGTGRLLFLATLGYTAVFTFQTTARYSAETRMLAENWLEAALPRGGTLVLCGWSRYMAVPVIPSRYTMLGRGTEAAIRNLDRDFPRGLIQITSLHYDRHVRHDNATYVNAYDRLRDPGGSFALVKRFESRFLNKRLYMKLDPMFGGYFVSPTLEFYRRKGVGGAAAGGGASEP